MITEFQVYILLSSVHLDAFITEQSVVLLVSVQTVIVYSQEKFTERIHTDQRQIQTINNTIYNNIINKLNNA